MLLTSERFPTTKPELITDLTAILDHAPPEAFITAENRRRPAWDLLNDAGRATASFHGFVFAPWARCFDCNAYEPTYAIEDDVWFAAWSCWAGALCPFCVEKRIGRDLTLDDFVDAPVNLIVRWAWARGREERSAL